jgi:hypothetical protein
MSYLQQIQKVIIAATALIALAACSATTPDTGPKVVYRLPTDAEVEQHNALVDPANRIMCRKETAVGSNIPERQCWVIRDLEAISELHRSELARVLR